MIRLRILIYSFLLFIPIFLNTQSLDNIGREFVVCFPENDDYENIGTKLEIVMINYSNQIGQIELHYLLDDIREKYEIEPESSIVVKPDPKYELKTINGIEKNSIIISSDSDISVVCISRTQSSADAYTALPINVLGRNHVISNIGNRNDDNFAQISIISVFDDTKVNVKTNAIIDDPLYTPHNNEFYSLNAGEVLVLTANVLEHSNLSGSYITSNNPIAVFSSHQRTSIPITDGYLDYIIDQVPSVEILGTECVISLTKFPIVSSTVFVRILPAFDSTIVKWKDKDTLLSRGQFLDINSKVSFIVKSDKPVLFSQFEQSARITLSKGDPFLVFLPPIQQWKNNYTFYSSELEDFTEHWANIVIHRDGINSLLLDGSLVNSNQFKQIEASDYYYAPISVKSGIHKVKSDSNFSLLVYGYGIIISYGYNGGMKADRLLEKIMDSNLPQLTQSEDCDTYIEITENNEYDSGIDDIAVSNSENVRVEINPFQKGDKSVIINLELIDNNDDGYAVLKTNDIKGHQRLDTVYLNGFNISSDYHEYKDSISYLGFRCDTIRLINNGRVASTFNLHFKGNTKISVPPTYGRITLNSGQDTLIPYCVYADIHNEISDILILKDVCDREKNYSMAYTIQSLSASSNTKCDFEIVIVTDLGNYIRSNEFDNNAVMKIYNLTGNELYSGAPYELNTNLNRGVYFIMIFENSALKSRYIVNVD